MEKKYYLRGLGLGIVVTAIIMGIALPRGTKTREMTDDEVITRAKELGMIEDSRLLEPTEEDTEEEAAAAAPETPVKKDIAVKTEAEISEAAGTTTSATSAETKPNADTNEMTKQDDDVNTTLSEPEEEEEEHDADPESAETTVNNGTNPASGGMKSITVVNGDSSYTIAKKLETVGAVSSASSYDTYLCEHGYDKKLRTGTFQIPAGATDEQIAKIVTGQQ